MLDLICVSKAATSAIVGCLFPISGLMIEFKILLADVFTQGGSDDMTIRFPVSALF